MLYEVITGDMPPEPREEDRGEGPAPSLPPSDEPLAPTVIELDPSELGEGSLRLGPRRGTTRRRESHVV